MAYFRTLYREMDQLAKSSIPSQFQKDFKECSFDSEEELVQCCTFPVRDRKERDNSTIIVFEEVPYTRDRNEEKNNTNLLLPRTESHFPPVPTEKQNKIVQNCQQMKSCHSQVVINNKIHEPFSLDSNDGEESRTNQMYKFKSHLVTGYSGE